MRHQEQEIILPFAQVPCLPPTAVPPLREFVDFRIGEKTVDGDQARWVGLMDQLLQGAPASVCRNLDISAKSEGVPARLEPEPGTRLWVGTPPQNTFKQCSGKSISPWVGRLTNST